MKRKMKKTKIVATISDKRCDVEFIGRLYRSGMDVIRLNTAFQSMEGALKVIRNAREVSEDIAVLIDTKGPEIRTNPVRDVVNVASGEAITIQGNPEKEGSRECIVEDVPVHSHIFIDDGSLDLYVKEKKANALICQVMNNGKIEGHKSVNVPRVIFKLPSLTEKDREYIQLSIEQDVDFIAHSFVRNKEDVLAIQDILDRYKSPIKIIAKIENREGVDNINEILDYAYGVMVARGDLAIEIPYEKIPGIQKMIIDKCISRRKPVIIATQMLYSMISNPRPTRAEVSDVANAILDGSDAIMLSGETATGQYPVEAVEMMTRIANETEKAVKSNVEDTSFINISDTVSRAIHDVCQSMPVQKVIPLTRSGYTARMIARFKIAQPIIAVTPEIKVKKQLELIFGVYPVRINYPDEKDRCFCTIAIAQRFR